MALNIIIVIMLVVSVVYGLLSGSIGALSTAALEGAKEAVNLCLALCGLICLWSAVMELMKRCGLSDKLSRLLRPLLKRLFPSASRNAQVMDDLSLNVSANLLGLGNAATPAGIRAAMGLKRLSSSNTASNELCRLVIMNTASIQLIPATVASIRSSLGAAAPFDILPAVWLSSLLSVSAGLLAAKFMERFSRP